MQVKELWVKRANLRETRVETREAAPLQDGEVRLVIDKFALTANNVSYAVSGDSIGYWKYFPAEGEWGMVPAWGFADVVESRSAEIGVGERIWGFLPMATHLTLKPGKVKADHFFDFTAHREPLPRLYNQYYRTKADPPFLKTLEDERCLLFPLFCTSYLVYDYLIDNAFFGAQQVVVASASSKTGLGLAHLLKNDKKLTQRVVGLTSPGNVKFVEGLKICHEVVTYDALDKLDASVPTAFVDMAGSGEVVRAVHERIGDNIKDSCLVGATHWEVSRKNGPLPGAKPTFFFAPSRFAKRDKDWGQGAVLMKAFGAGAQIAASIKGQIEIVPVRGTAAVEQMFSELIENKVPPSRGLMLSLGA